MSTPPPLPPHNPYAAPSAPVEMEAPVTELELADRGTRLAAALIDGLLVGVLVIVAAIMIPAVVGPDGKANEAMAAVLGLVLVAGLIALLAINMVLLHRYGQTIAKRWLKIRVVRSNGEPVELWRFIVLRWLPVTLLGAIPLIGYVVSLVDPLMIFRSDYRCLHDLIADTIVVKA